MKTELILIGKTNDKHFQAGIDDYTSRISHYMPFSITVIPELKNTKALSEAQQKEREGEMVLAKLQPSDHVVLLDEHGKAFRSVEFARWIEQKNATVRRLVFVIGGAYGFSFSHQMVRLVFTEQIYRACTIIKGEPYHHE